MQVSGRQAARALGVEAGLFTVDTKPPQLRSFPGTDKFFEAEERERQLRRLTSSNFRFTRRVGFLDEVRARWAMRAAWGVPGVSVPPALLCGLTGAGCLDGWAHGRPLSLAHACARPGRENSTRSLEKSHHCSGAAHRRPRRRGFVAN